MKVIAALIVHGDARRWLPCVNSLLQQSEITKIVIASHNREAYGAIGSHPMFTYLEHVDSAAVLEEAQLENPDAAVLMVWAPVLAAPECLKYSVVLLEDPRVGTVSFFSNAAGYLSLPHRNREVNHQIEDLDEIGINRRLRDLAPNLGVVPIPVAAGPAVLVSRCMIDLLGFGCQGVAPGQHLADLSLAGLRRGLISVLDTSTFMLRPSDLAPIEPDPLANPHIRDWLATRHHFFEAGYQEAMENRDSPLSIAHAASAAKIRGLRVLLDGTCLGPREMGTQVHLLALLESLTERADVRSVCIAIPGPTPAYAEKALSHAKVQSIVSSIADFAGVERGDVLHRSFQPDRPLPLEQWREAADRIVITLQDLIGFEIGAYFQDGGDWTNYRTIVRTASRQADGVTVISHDSGRQVKRNQISIAPDRLFVVPCGTDHLVGDEPAVIPAELVDRGLIAGSFLLAIGANYSHKNRDLAIRTWKELRRRGHSQQLILVGAAVPMGSSRWEEASALGFEPTEEVISLPDVDSAGRNWLLRHADAVIYPTSAEGFGLVPFEAARFGTPTVMVNFGPLAETSPENPVAAASWSPSAMADAAEALLLSPSNSAAQVAETLKAGGNYTWRQMGADLVEVYRQVLGLPIN
jgi:glycosyltransferase involved in cell wall biosynthesis